MYRCDKRTGGTRCDHEGYTCEAYGQLEDEVTGRIYCSRHAGPLAWSNCKVNAYTIAVRVAGHLDVPVADAWMAAAA